MRTKTFSAKKLLSLMLAIAMMITMVLPTNVFAAFVAATNGTISNNIETVTLAVGETAEFTVSTKANDDAGAKVIGRYEIDSDTAISKMEFYKDDSWIALDKANKGDFGETAGFAFEDTEYKFRVTFAETGTYKFKVSVVAFDGVYGREMCSETDEIKVVEYADFEELKVAIVNAGTYSSDKYTTASYKALTEAITDAEKAIAEKWTSDEQDAVDKLTNAINKAITELVELADYSELSAIYNVGKAYTNTSGKYTVASLNALELALAEAEKDANKELTVQAEVDKLVEDIEDAIAALVEVKEVTFTAVAVANDAKVDYAKANKIVLVFAEPIADGSDVLSRLSIDDSVEKAEWSNENTVYTLTLKEDHQLKDATKVVFNSDEKIMTKLGYALAKTEAVVVGNLEEAYEQVTATKMAATIVKSSDKPGVVAGDKIVLVFNAPVYGNPPSIEVNGYDAKAVDGTSNTVYEITLKDNDNVSDETTLTYGTIADVSLDGTFGKAEAPVVVAAVAVDNNGSALTAGDEVVVYFDKPTNGVAVDASKIVKGAVKATWNDANTELTLLLGESAEVSKKMTINLGGLGIADEYNLASYVASGDISLKGEFIMPVAPVIYEILAVDNNGNAIIDGDQIVVYFDRPTNKKDINDKLTTIAGGVLGTHSHAEWNDAGTVLTITLGNDANVVKGMKFNFGGLGIEDADGTIEYEGKEINLNGEFVTPVAPIVTDVIAVDNNGNATTNGDNIIITFDRPTNGIKTLNLENIIKNSNYGIGTDYSYKWNNDDTQLVITLGEYATLIDGLTLNLGNIGIMDEFETIDYEGVDVKIEGSFGTTVAPKITRAIAFTQNNKHIIRVFFNTEVTVSGAMSVYIENFDDDNAQGKWTHNGISYYDMTLGENHDAFVSNHYVIKFEGTLLDSETLKSSVVDASATIKGGFEQDIEPEILSFTAYSNDGSGMAKAGDKLVLVFNSSVTEVKSEGKNFVSKDGGVTWIYELSKDNEVNKGDLVKFTVKALGNTKEMSANIAGSFGYKAELKLLSATAVNPDATGLVKGGEIYVAASLPIKKFVAQGLGEVTQAETDGTIWKIKLADDAVVAIGDDLEFHITNAVTNESEVLSVKLTGSFGYYVAPEVIKATAYSKDGSGIAKENDTVIVTFNTAVTNVSVSPEIGLVEAISTTDNYNYVITLGANPTDVVVDKLTLAFTATSIVTGETKTIENVKLGGSFGYKVTPEVVSATAYSNDGSGIAKVNDVVVVVFNTPVNATVAEAFGTATKMDTYGNVWKITLASNSGAEVGKKFAINATSVATGEVATINPELGGSFGTIIEPKLISATAYSNDGSGIAKVGDKIVLVFNAPVSGVASTLGTVTDVKDSTVWEISLASTTVEIGNELIFNVTSVANGTTREVKANLGGSFGKVIVPSIKSVTAISNDGSGVAKTGDRIVVVFDAAVRVGAADAESTYVYTYTLTSSDVSDGTFAIGSDYKIDVWSVATGAKHTLESVVGGSYGYSEAPAVKSVVLTESGLKEIITVVFDQATSMNDINTSKLFEKNAHLGQTVTAVWTSDTVLKITLAADATTIATVLDDEKNYVSGDWLNLSGLDIKAKATNLDIEGINELAISGSLVPVVTEAKVDGTVITIKFSARTNGSADALTKIEAQTVLYGTGVNAEWTDNNRALVITMGANNALPIDAYIVLNDLGIKDGFSNTVEVKGQYAIDTKLLNRNLLGVTVFVKGVNTENTERTDYTAGQAGDQILVVFDAPTNKTQGSDAKANIELTDGKTFGTDYTAVWTSDSLITITLGEGATVTTEDKLVVKNVKFANGTGKLSDADADKTEEVLEGQFDGRQFWIEDLAAATVAGLKRYSATIKQAPMTVLNAESMPFVICQGYDANGKVVTIGAVQISGAYTQNVKFDFNNSGLTKIDMFVISGDYADAEAVVTVYSETESK